MVLRLAAEQGGLRLAQHVAHGRHIVQLIHISSQHSRVSGSSSQVLSQRRQHLVRTVALAAAQ